MMTKWFWVAVMLLMSVLTANADEVSINKNAATATGNCGATCNPISWIADFSLVDKKGRVDFQEVVWILEVRVRCDLINLETTRHVAVTAGIRITHSGEICKHDGIFGVVSVVEIRDDRGRTIDADDFVHTTP